MSSLTEVAFDLLKIVCKRDDLKKSLENCNSEMRIECEQTILKYQKYIEDCCKENNFTVNVVEKFIYNKLLVD